MIAFEFESAKPECAAPRRRRASAHKFPRREPKVPAPRDAAQKMRAESAPFRSLTLGPKPGRRAA